MNEQYKVYADLVNGTFVIHDPQNTPVVTLTHKHAADLVCKELNHLLKMVQENYESQPQAAS